MSKLVKRYCYECDNRTEMAFDRYENIGMLNERNGEREMWRMKWMKCPKCGRTIGFTRRRILNTPTESEGSK